MPSTISTFFLRLGSTLVLWTIILSAMLSGQEVAYFLLIGVVALLGLWEYFRMLDHQGIVNFKLTAILTAAVFILGSFYEFRVSSPARSYDFELAVLVLFLLVVFSRQMFAKMRDHKPLEAMAYTLFGLLYIPWLLNFMTKIVYVTPRLADGDPTGQYYILYVVAVTKFTDMGAYTFGSLFGKHPFAPHISPKKSWEGFWGALVSGLLTSYWMYALMPEKLHALRFIDLTVLGLLLAFAAVIGDLVESMIKRSAETKDSSRLLPGIGGTLDLIDSLLFTAPLLYFYMRLVLGMG